jgi:two-component system, OmpR family, sensor histidine kinase BaeS
MFKSLHLKFFLILFAVALVALSGTFMVRQLMIRDFTAYLEGTAEDIVYGLLANFEGAYEKDNGWKEENLKQLITWALSLGYDIRVLNKDDQLINDTQTVLNQATPAMKRRMAALARLMESPNGHSYTPYPLFLSGMPIGTLEVRTIQPARESLFMRRAVRFLLFSAIMVGTLALIISFVFSRRLTRPIKDLSIAASAISHGDFSSRVKVKRQDEVGDLAVSFNSMAEALASQEQLRRKLIADVAHELRTPLAVMKGEIEAMIDGLMAIDDKRLESLSEETDRLKRMVEAIEELNRVEASALVLNRQSVHLHEFLTSIINRFRPSFDEKVVSLALHCDEKSEAHADPERLSQIVINLLSNALRATEAGGCVSVTAYQDSDGVTITVADTGKGINAHDLPNIFERFYKGSGGGLGIGLTIVKELIEAHGGRIEVKSKQAEGSTFTIYLPGHGIHSLS